MLSEINKIRLENFKKTKRGYYSFLLFCLLLFLSFFAEFIANDKPILLKFDDKYYLPIFFSYPETEFGGVFETEADYKDQFFLEDLSKKGWAIWPPIKFSYNTINYARQANHPAPPDKENLLGTDDRGRDILAMTIYGFRISVVFGLILTILSSLIGIFIGALQGYIAGWFDLVMERFRELWDSIPNLLVLIIVASVFEINFIMLIFIVLMFKWTGMVGAVRAEVLKVRNFEYVTAAKALGVKTPRLIFTHILPNSLVTTVTKMPFVVSAAITTLTSLDFLGFGLPAEYPSLGEILSQAKQNLQAPWLGITGFVIVSVMLSLLVFTGEAARDALAPNKVFRK